MKLPAFQFYPGDWRKDPGVQALDYAERGIWIEILCLMHESEDRGRLLLGGKPFPTDRLARILCLSAEVMSKVISDLITLGVASVCQETGALVCRRMVRDEEIRRKRAQGGKLGGNPQFMKGKPNPYYDQTDKQKDNQGHKQKITPSSSSSSSSSSSDGKRERPAKPRDDRVDHPALIAIREVKGRFPHKDVWDLLIKVIGQEPNTERLRECWVAWRAKNFGPENLGWATDWYVNGIPGSRNGNGAGLSKAERSQEAGRKVIERYEREDRESAANH